MPRPAVSAARREQITSALLRVLAERGWAHATTAEIAKAANLAPGLIHYYFGSRQEILLELVQKMMKTVSARFERRAATVGDNPRARLFAFLDAHVAIGEDADPFAVRSWAAIGAEAGHQSEVREVYSRAIGEQLDAIEALVIATLKKEERGVRHARFIAAGLVSAIEGAYRIATSAPGVLPEGFAEPTLRALAEGLLAAQPSARARS
jgi:TetR/AcrR family transcriptional repressor of bet genes